MTLSYPPAIANGGPNDSPKLLSNGWPASWIAEDPDANDTSPAAVYEAALTYINAGLSVIPIDGEEPNKSPCPRRMRSWKIYQLRRPRPEELLEWLECGGAFGLAVVGGTVSGGQKGCSLEIIDFDSFELATPWIDQVEARVPGLTNRLVMVQSPRPGLHVYFRSAAFGECQKLACAPIADVNGAVIFDEHGRPKKTTLIELKAEGGYCLVPPSPRRCHPRNQLYRLLDGSPPLTEIPMITTDERNILIEEARRFNRWTESEPRRITSVSKAAGPKGNRPGDDFERRISWADILEPHGWVLVGQRGEIEYWRRPGKSDGISATVNYCDRGWFHVFSSNADPFDDGRSYAKFTAYALLYHGGDFKKAAKALQQDGFGPKSLPAGKRTVSGGIQTISLGGKL